MSGFFKRFTRKKNTSADNSSAESDSAHDAQNESSSWTEHEISHDIVEAPESPPKFDKPEHKPKSEAVKKVATVPDRTDSSATVEIAALPAADLANAMDIAIDPLDDITAQIQAQIAEEKRIKAKQEERRRIIETTDEFRRPEWKEEPLKPEE